MKTAQTFALSCLALFAPAKGMFLTALFLVLADLILGISASKKEGKPITSRWFRRTVSKLCVYELVIGITFLAQIHLIGDNLPVLNIVTAYIGITELKSIIENLNRLSGEPLLKKLISKITVKEDTSAK